jgi:hypothetical protein
MRKTVRGKIPPNPLCKGRRRGDFRSALCGHGLPEHIRALFVALTFSNLTDLLYFLFDFQIQD